MKGVYCLVIEIDQDIVKKIGSLGDIAFKQGKCIYVGSAQKHLEQRIRRHRSIKKKQFWHIDYLLSSKNVKISEVLWKDADKQEECNIASFLFSAKPVNRFGCSDCICRSHLFMITEKLQSKMKIEMRMAQYLRRYKKY